MPNKTKQLLIDLAQIAGYLLAVFMVIALLAIPVRFIFGESDSVEARLQILIIGIMLLGATGIVSIIMVHIGKSRLITVGWLNMHQSIKWFAKGSMFGLIITGAIFLVMWLTGAAHFSFNHEQLPDYLPYVLPLIFYILVAAIGEEWMFRGYPLSKLSQSVGRDWANFIVALFFMAGHWGGDGWSVMTIINILLFSLLCGAFRFTEGGLPVVCGFHFSWNSLQVLLGATLTGENFKVPFIKFESSGADWLSGGIYGPEGSLATTAIMLISLIIIYKYQHLNRYTLKGKRVSKHVI